MAEKNVKWRLDAEAPVVDVLDQIMNKAALADAAMAKVGGSLSMVAGILAGGLGIASMVSAFGSFVEGAAKLDDLASKAGTTVEKIAALGKVSKLSGTSIDDLVGGMAKLSKGVINATGDTEGAARALKFLGVSATDANGKMKDAGTLTEEIAVKLAKLEDGMGKTAIVTDLYGKAGANLIPVLKDIAEFGLQESTVTRAQAIAAKEYEQDLIRLGMAKGALAKIISAELLPVAGAVVKTLLEWEKGAGGVRDSAKALAEDGSIRAFAMMAINSIGLVISAGDSVGRIFTVVGEAVGAAMARAANTLGAIGSGLIAFARQDYVSMWSILKDATEKDGAIVAASGERVREVFEKPLAGEAFVASVERNLRVIDGKMRESGSVAKSSADEYRRAGKDADALTKSVDALLDKLYSKAAGFESSFLTDVGLLSKAFTTGRLSIASYTAALMVLTSMQPNVKAAMKALEDAADAVAKDEIALAAAQGQQIESLIKQVEQERLALDTRELTKSQVEALTLLRMEDRLEVLRGMEGADLEVKSLEKQIQLRRELVGIFAAGEARQAEIKAQREQIQLWDQLGNAAVNFFEDLVTNGRDAFGNLRKYVKQLFVDLMALFAKQWFLQIVAGATGNTAAGSAANAAGNQITSNVAGAALNWGATALGYTGGIGTATQFGGAFIGAAGSTSAYAIPTAAIGSEAVAAGVGVDTAAAAWGAGLYEALAAIPVWGWIAAAVIAVAAWLGGRHKGGPKIGGSYMAGFSGANGEIVTDMSVPGSDNGRFYTPNQADSAVRDMVHSTASGFYDTLRRLGGTTSGGFGFGLGFDHDPNGTARSGVSAMLTDANGNVLYQAGTSVDDKAVPEQLQLEAQRMILVALQNSQLPDAVSQILNSITAQSASLDDIKNVINAAIEMKQVLDGLAEINLKGLDIDALKAWQREGESIGQTFQRVATEWGDFNNAFLSDDQKLSMAWTNLTDVFGQFGYSVPESNQAFLDLVSSLDLSTEAGRAAFEAFHSAIPTFQAVQNAVTNMVNGIIENLRGPMDPQMALNAQLRIFQANNPWTQGMGLNDIMGALLTITEDDLAAYIRAGQGSNISEISRLYRLTQNGGGSVGGGGGGVPPDVQALWDMVNAAKEAARALEEMKAGLRSWLDGLLLDKTLSPLDPMEQLALARKRYEDVLALAQGGDLTAMGQLSGVADTYLKLARGIYASGAEYDSIFRTVFDAVAKIAGGTDFNSTMVTIQQRQAETMANVYATLMTIRDRGDENAVYVAQQVREGLNEVRDAVRNSAIASEMR